MKTDNIVSIEKQLEVLSDVIYKKRLSFQENEETATQDEIDILNSIFKTLTLMKEAGEVYLKLMAE